MIETLFSLQWPSGFSFGRTVTKPPRRSPEPVFIGDAAQPWGAETLLLDILRRQAQFDGDN